MGKQIIGLIMIDNALCKMFKRKIWNLALHQVVKEEDTKSISIHLQLNLITEHDG